MWWDFNKFQTIQSRSGASGFVSGVTRLVSQCYLRKLDGVGLIATARTVNDAVVPVQIYTCCHCSMGRNTIARALVNLIYQVVG